MPSPDPLQAAIKKLEDARYKLASMAALFQSGRVSGQLPPPSKQRDEGVAQLVRSIDETTRVVQVLCNDVYYITSLPEAQKLAKSP